METMPGLSSPYSGFHVLACVSKRCQNMNQMVLDRQMQQYVCGSGWQGCRAHLLLKRSRACHLPVTASMCLHVSKRCQNINQLVPERQMQHFVCGSGWQGTPTIETMPGLSSPCYGLHVPASVRTLLSDILNTLSCTDHQLCEGSYILELRRSTSVLT
jgi:hypothetical protein